MMRRLACVAAIVASAATLSGQDRAAKTLNIYVPPAYTSGGEELAAGKP